MNNTMTDDELMQELRQLNYTDNIDVVDAVMAQVQRQPLFIPKSRKNVFQRVAVAVAACAVLAVTVNFTYIFTRSYNEAQIGDAIAMVYNYNENYAGSSDSYDLGLVELLYE